MLQSPQTGRRGPAGPQGPAGANGAQGPQGPQGLQGPAGPAGANGATGSSAYQVAVANGFVGTELQWLASLVGASGPIGPAGPQGPQGIQGIQGPAGPAGADGVGFDGMWNVITVGGLVGDDATNNATVLAAFDATAFAAGKTLYFPKPAGQFWIGGANITLQSNCVFDEGAILHITNGSVTFSGKVNAWITQIVNLGAAGTVKFNRAKNLVGYAEWLGAKINNNAVENSVFINSALDAIGNVQLMGGVYYTSARVQYKKPSTTLKGVGYWADGVSAANFSGVGAATFDANSFSTVICCTSASATIVDVGWGGVDGVNPNAAGDGAISSRGSTLKNMLVTRSIAPSKASNCIGVRMVSNCSNIENVFSAESMIGFYMWGTWDSSMRKCFAYRKYAGTGAGTDYWYGFWMDGTPVTGNTSGNAEIMMYDLNANSANTGVNSIGMYCTGGNMDTSISKFQSNRCTTGCKIVGAAGARSSDFFMDHMVFDYCYGEGLVVQDTQSLSHMQINNVHIGQAPIIYNAALKILNSLGKLNIGDVQVTNDVNVNSGLALDIQNSKYVSVRDMSTVEERGIIARLSGCTNCKVQIEALNLVGANQGVSLLNSHRNKIEVSMMGNQAGTGVTLDAASDYNEINVSGIDPAVISGGAANKLLVNGFSVTTAGIISAYGAGHNVAVGVMN